MTNLRPERVWSHGILSKKYTQNTITQNAKRKIHQKHRYHIIRSFPSVVGGYLHVGAIAVGQPIPIWGVQH